MRAEAGGEAGVRFPVAVTAQLAPLRAAENPGSTKVLLRQKPAPTGEPHTGTQKEEQLSSFSPPPPYPTQFLGVSFCFLS